MQKCMNGSKNWILQLQFRDKIIILGEAKKKYKQINIIIVTTKMVIYSNRSSALKSHLKQVKLGMKKLFRKEKIWAEIFLGKWHPIYNEMAYPKL